MNQTSERDELFNVALPLLLNEESADSTPTLFPDQPQQ